MTNQELIETLTKQHRKLQKDLTSALEKSNDISNKKDEILIELTTFKTDLLEHLELENGTFYPAYLEKKKELGESIQSTEEFINKMSEIGEKVFAFLNKYSTTETIKENPTNFTNELSTITATLNTRVETEEEGVYGVFLLL